LRARAKNGQVVGDVEVAGRVGILARAEQPDGVSAGLELDRVRARRGIGRADRFAQRELVVRARRIARGAAVEFIDESGDGEGRRCDAALEAFDDGGRRSGTTEWAEQWFDHWSSAITRTKRGGVNGKRFPTPRDLSAGARAPVPAGFCRKEK
jgi:hypothetical protein